MLTLSQAHEYFKIFKHPLAFTKNIIMWQNWKVMCDVDLLSWHGESVFLLLSVTRQCQNVTMATSAGKYREFRRENTNEGHLSHGWIPRLTFPIQFADQHLHLHNRMQSVKCAEQTLSKSAERVKRAAC